MSLAARSVAYVHFEAVMPDTADDIRYSLAFLIEDRSESPIESSLGVAWYKRCVDESCEFVIGGSPKLFLENVPPKTPSTPLHVSRYDMIMQQVEVGKYRADFILGRAALAPIFDDTGSPHPFLVRLPMLVVECDGHDFHEKTKEQAARDKSRDREFTRLGYRVIRFSGSEIYRDAEKCIDEISDIFESMLEAV